MNGSSLSLVLPVKDDAANLRHLVLECLAVVPRYFADFELIIVIDGPYPATLAVVEDLLADYEPVMLIHLPRERGYGVALAGGWQAARGDYILCMDTGGEVSITDLGRMLPYLQSNDVVLGYFMQRQHSLMDRSVDRMLTRLLNLVFALDLHDISCRFAIFRGDLLRRMPTVSRGSLVLVELFVRARELGVRRVQVGVNHAFRSADAGIIPPSLLDVVRLRLRIRWGRPIHDPAPDWRPLWRRRVMQSVGLFAASGSAWIFVRRFFSRR